MSYDFEKVSVLIAEDNQPMLDLTKSLMATFGVKKILSASNGDMAFKMYCAESPDLVIADWMMKPVDGISLTRRIRKDPSSPNQYTPVILMTGFSEKRRVMEARDSGVTEFLVKPFNARDLYRRITQVIEKPRQFVRSEDFFGPDRRRRMTREFIGPFLRHTDVRPEDYDNNRKREIEAEFRDID